MKAYLSATNLPKLPKGLTILNSWWYSSLQSNYYWRQGRKVVSARNNGRCNQTFLLDMTMSLHTWSDSGCVSTHKSCTGERSQSPSMDWGGGKKLENHWQWIVSGEGRVSFHQGRSPYKSNNAVVDNHIFIHTQAMLFWHSFFFLLKKKRNTRIWGKCERVTEQLKYINGELFDKSQYGYVWHFKQ